MAYFSAGQQHGAPSPSGNPANLAPSYSGEGGFFSRNAARERRASLDALAQRGEQLVDDIMESQASMPIMSRRARKSMSIARPDQRGSGGGAAGQAGAGQDTSSPFEGADSLGYISQATGSLEVNSKTPSAPPARKMTEQAEKLLRTASEKSTAYRHPALQARDITWTLFTEPSSSPYAKWISYIVFLFIFTSTFNMIIESIPNLAYEEAERAFNTIEMICVIAFTIEFLVKLFTTPSYLDFVKGPMNWIDFVAIAPWYIERFSGSALAGTAVLRVLRLARILRVLKLGSRSEHLSLLMRAMVLSADMLGMAAFCISILILIFATLMHFVEGGEDDKELGYKVRPGEKMFDSDGNPVPSPFDSIPKGFWWAIVTFMTVGYGDVYPLTVGGKLITALAMVVGVLSLALPISIIGGNFTEEWFKYKEGGSRIKLSETELFKKIAADQSDLPVAALEARLELHESYLERLTRVFIALEEHMAITSSRFHERLRTQLKSLTRGLGTATKLIDVVKEFEAAVRREEHGSAASSDRYDPLTLTELQDMRDLEGELDQQSDMLQASMALLKQLCDEQHIATLRRLNALYKASKLAQHDMRELNESLDILDKMLSRAEDSAAFAAANGELPTRPLERTKSSGASRWVSVLARIPTMARTPSLPLAKAP